MNRFAIYGSAIALGLCLNTTSRSAAAQQVVAELPAGLIIPIPAGYGRYCSVVTASGIWDFQFGGPTSDPCATILANIGGTVKRAGIYSLAGSNNVMARCGSQGPSPYVVRGSGSTILSSARADNTNGTNCIFIVAPTALPIFGHPWQPQAGQTDPDIGVASPTGFDYNIFGGYTADPHTHWDVTNFGQAPNPPNTTVRFAVGVDRRGIEQAHSGDSGECLLGLQGCVKSIPGRRANEGAYDWIMDDGRPLLAVAPGVIRAARMRNVAGMCGPLARNQTQGEIFIESQVDTGWYAEHFVAAYHHMWNVNVPSTSVPWPAGNPVGRGTVISAVGNTGCSNPAHLDLSVIRLTNLTGTYGYTFQALPVDPTDAPSWPNYYGVNGAQGAIDPFGWAAPAGIDPWAYSFIGFDDPNYPKANLPGLTDPGAFSINLWIQGTTPNQPPPTY